MENFIVIIGSIVFIIFFITCYFLFKDKKEKPVKTLTKKDILEIHRRNYIEANKRNYGEANNITSWKRKMKKK